MIKTILAAVGLGLLSLPLQAQDAPLLEETESKDAYNINTKGHSPDDDAPNQVQTRVSLEQSKLNYDELSDKLDKIPGLSTQQSGFGQAIYAAIRGGNPRQNRVLWQGLKLSLPFGPGFDFSSLDSAGFDEILVLKSGSSATKGSGALTGAIELRSGPMKGNRIYERSYALGSFGTVKRGFKFGLKEGDNFATLTVGTRHSTGDFSFIDQQGTPHLRIGNDSGRVQVGTTIGRRLSQKWQNRFSVLWSDLERGAPGPSEFQRFFSKARNAINQVHLVNELVGQDLTSPFFDDAQVKFLVGISGSDFSYNNPEAFLGALNFNSQSTHRRVSSEASVRVFSEGFTSTTRLGVGFDRYQTRTQSKGEEEKGDHQRSELSIKSALEWYWTQYLVGFGNVALDGIDSTLLTSVNLGLSLALNDEISLRLNGAKSSRAPDLDELFLTSESVRGNPNLGNESAWTADFSLNIDMGALRFESTFFTSMIENTILFLPVSSFLIEANNISNFQSFGSENTFALSFRHLDVSLWYTLTIADPAGFQAPHQARHKGGISVELKTKIGAYAIHSGRMFLNARARSEVNLDLFGSIRNPASLQLNGGLALRIDSFTGAEIHISLGVKNILDDQKQSDFLQRPLPGRQVYGVLQFNR